MITPLTFDSVLYVCLHMQEIEQRERKAIIFDYNPYVHAVDIWTSSRELAYTAWYGDRPAVVGGLRSQRPGVVSTWMAGTDDWPHVVRSVTRAARNVFDHAFASGVHRIETLSAGFHTAAHRWFRLLGLEQEACLRKYGCNGEDFFLFSKVR